MSCIVWLNTHIISNKWELKHFLVFFMINIFFLMLWEDKKELVSYKWNKKKNWGLTPSSFGAREKIICRSSRNLMLALAVLSWFPLWPHLHALNIVRSLVLPSSCASSKRLPLPPPSCSCGRGAMAGTRTSKCNDSILSGKYERECRSQLSSDPYS